jgi:hypothetical protein
MVAKLHPQITQCGRKKEKEFEFNKQTQACTCARLVIWRFEKRGKERKSLEKTKSIRTSSM